MRDVLYEDQIKQHCQTVIIFLDKYAIPHNTEWNMTDYYALERVLQILIEACIGIARYFVKIKYQIQVAKSRESFDQLKRYQNITSEEYDKIMKIIGFRNILVHDYLDIETKFVESIVKKKEYKFIEQFIDKLLLELNIANTANAQK